MEIKASFDASAITRAANKAVMRLKARAEQAIEQTMTECGPVIETECKQIFHETIQDFYASYSPVYYERTESLYDIFEITVNSKTIRTGYDPSKLTSSNGTLSGVGLYELVFKNGWHGGAPSGPEHPNPGVPYWRAPHPYYYYWSQPASSAVVGSTGPAQSPYEDFERKMDRYFERDGRYSTLIHETFHKYWHKS